MCVDDNSKCNTSPHHIPIIPSTHRSQMYSNGHSPTKSEGAADEEKQQTALAVCVCCARDEYMHAVIMSFSRQTDGNDSPCLLLSPRHHPSPAPPDQTNNNGELRQAIVLE